MGVIGSLPLTDNNDIKNEPSFNESTNDIMSVINDDHKKTYHHQRPSETMIHNYLCVKKYPLVASRLRTRRCLTGRRFENIEIIKHKLRCRKNRQLIRKLQLKREYMIEQLIQRAQELELKQNDLLSEIETLRLYKQRLEFICQQISPNPQFIG
jgi:hypothetical protein